MSSSTQTLKSALDARVRIDQSSRLGSNRQNLGEGLMCPAGSGELQNDVYGRPVAQTTLLLNDSSCSNYTKYSAQDRISVENNERPYLPHCSASLNSTDLINARNLLPQNLYGEGEQGNMVRHYPTPDNLPFHEGSRKSKCNYYHRRIPPFSFSHDATTSSVWRG